MSILKFVMQKILLPCKTETKPKHNASTYHLPPPAESHYLLLEKLKELHYRVNIFATIGIPYLVKSMHAWNPYMRKQVKAKSKGCNGAVQKGLKMPKLTPGQSRNQAYIILFNFRLPLRQRRMEARLLMHTVVNGLELPVPEEVACD